MGLNDPNVPTQGGWGGYFAWGKGEDNETSCFTNCRDPQYSICRSLEEHFYSATFNNFAARMDWAKDGAGNRNPVVVIDGDTSLSVLTRKPQQGTKVTLDASQSQDPDGDSLHFNWWVLMAAGTYERGIEITGSDSSVATVTIPADSAGKAFHVICEATDNGTHRLPAYRRIIFDPVE